MRGSPRGGGAPKSTNLWFRGSSRITAGRLSARQSRRLADLEVIAFRLGVPPAILTPFQVPLHSALGKRLGRSDRRRLVDPKVVSQLPAGLLSEPGGSPSRRPGVRPARPDPPGAAPHPASRRLMIAPLNGRGGCRIDAAQDAGMSSLPNTERKNRPQTLAGARQKRSRPGGELQFGRWLVRL